MSQRGVPETVRLVHEQEDLITDLRRQLDAAEARALAAEHEIEAVRAEQQARRDRATARAERAEAENTELRAKVGRVWVLSATWGEREPYHTVEYQFAIADLLAALDGPPDSTDPVEDAPEPRDA